MCYFIAPVPPKVFRVSKVLIGLSITLTSCFVTKTPRVTSQLQNTTVGPIKNLLATDFPAKTSDEVILIRSRVRSCELPWVFTLFVDGIV